MGAHDAAGRGFAALLILALGLTGLCEGFCVSGALEAHAEHGQAHCSTDGEPGHAPAPAGTTDSECGAWHRQLTAPVGVLKAGAICPAAQDDFQPREAVPMPFLAAPVAGAGHAAGPPGFPLLPLIAHHTTVLRI